MSDGEQGGAKQRLFLAAVRVFAAKGYKGATVRDICHEAGGANLNAINYYYGGKKNLYRAVLEVLVTEGDRRIRERLVAAGEVPATEQLRLLLHESCRLYFSGCEVTRAFMRLWLMELANPTPFFAEMVERHSLPQIEAALDLLAAVVGPDAPRELLFDCLAGLIGPAVYRTLVWPALRPLFPDHPDMETYWPHMADNLYRFAMAGLSAVRDGLAETSHGTGA